MKNPADFTYYCLFDPNTGRKVAGYVAELHTVPEDAVKVSYNDFLLYSKSNNYRYNWETKEPEYVVPEREVDLENLRTEVLELISEVTKNRIISGFIVKLGNDYVRFDSDIESQSTYNNNVLNATLNPDTKWEVRGYVNNAATKTVLSLSADEMRAVQEACSNHINTEKKRGWELQDYARNSSRTVEELLVLETKLKAYLEKEAAN